MSNNDKGSLKTKLIVIGIAVVVLLIAGIYLGIQISYNARYWAIQMQNGMITFVFWLVIILLIAAVIGFFVLRNKWKNR